MGSMRELSPQEKAFLASRVPDAGRVEAPSGVGRRGASRTTASRFSAAMGSLARYLPLAIGTLTLVFAGIAGYLYIWGLDFFKISELRRMSADGTLNLMDSTSGSWLEETLKVFEVAPWLILCTVVVGVLLMGLSMLLIGKRKNG